MKTCAVKVFAAALLAGALMKAFVLDIAIVSGSSMAPALRDGQRVLVYKLAWGLRMPLSEQYLLRWGSPEPGDIAVFLRDGTYTIKRCIATEGMALIFSDEGGYSVLAGDELIPLSAEQYKRLIHEAGAIPRGSVFVAGDNRDASFDSRDYGLVSADAFCGKVWLAGGH